MLIGVLGLQGAVSEHERMLTDCGAETRRVKTTEDLNGLDGIVVPGGESTAIRKLLVRENMLEPLRDLVAQGLPTFGTCAGMVLLAQPESLAGIHADVERNGFGRQRESFETDLQVTGWDTPFHGVFIRAPYLKSVSAPAEALITLDDGRIVAATEKNVLTTAFHPELTGDKRFHQYFIDEFVKATTKTA